MRVSELAKKLNIESKDTLTALTEKLDLDQVQS